MGKIPKFQFLTNELSSEKFVFCPFEFTEPTTFAFFAKVSKLNLFLPSLPAITYICTPPFEILSNCSRASLSWITVLSFFSL